MHMVRSGREVQFKVKRCTITLVLATHESDCIRSTGVGEVERDPLGHVRIFHIFHEGAWVASVRYSAPRGVREGRATVIIDLSTMQKSSQVKGSGRRAKEKWAICLGTIGPAVGSHHVPLI